MKVQLISNASIYSKNSVASRQPTFSGRLTGVDVSLALEAAKKKLSYATNEWSLWSKLSIQDPERYYTLCRENNVNHVAYAERVLAEAKLALEKAKRLRIGDPF